MSDHERIRLVILGGAGVGKSCIVKRFLFNTFADKYRSTVEDLYNREYDLGPVTLKVDILDTAGDMQFPAMRRLSIATAHAFLLVYATTSATSFDSIKRCFDEIREQRADYQDIPFVVSGNKLDLASTHREVTIEDVSEWVYCELPKLRVKVLECSAKDDYNIKEIFRCFLTLSRILPAGGDDSSGGLKRRSSAYVSASSKSKGGRRTGSPASESMGASAAASTEGATGGLEVTRSKPRSRSLIRRSSRKTKQQMRDAHDDCSVS
ncbi:GTP-binding protein Di-Ras1 [Zootermopsis nevadensis]|uniref:GTP-binding protein Di-Ras2 n=1 Tax=Zootermopsis nevadensis TaxID=136037 RepID=A0A067QZK0_ZOONE|nr:GTP-binding protein Di-Ras1 [Zootermopsis nevadensis]XP_021928520.1 GTP-binding protein Di-Ras1 [Zootermopsis nevadensis]XP_021928521.1 GTP-binding protein Di-Ras1 [Zootermopsis nevadensis]XP_021928522.1 GTP-binding protein Di-Ras1 [Zootermopsis nevadensis]XP_021928523.1 GTP-binding protein Di-Ras1 [Zootermopsis nevadensis]KDR14940.1 GTP-binding protein Di-Ras2 [Zootermopsis nevadensis]